MSDNSSYCWEKQSDQIQQRAKHSINEKTTLGNESSKQLLLLWISGTQCWSIQVLDKTTSVSDFDTVVSVLEKSVTRAEGNRRGALRRSGGRAFGRAFRTRRRERSGLESTARSGCATKTEDAGL